MHGTWTVEAIAGKSADVYLPPHKPRFGVLYLHSAGLQTLRDRMSFTRWFDELHLACVCPHGQRCWWADRICPEFDGAVTAERFLLQSVVPAFAARWGLGEQALGLLGISMGGQGALRLAFKHAQRFPVVSAISPALEYHQLYGQGSPIDEMYSSKEQCRQDSATLHVPPRDYPPHIFFCTDPDDAAWYRGADRLHEKLNALSIPHECDLKTQAGGHSWSYYDHMAERAVRFLANALELESRRLL